MRDIVNSPIFLRLGARLRGPAGVRAGELRRINISNIAAYNADPRYASIISGIPGHDIEDLRLTNVRIYYRGGGTNEQAALEPPERETNYPEPSMFGTIPAYGFFIRHVKGLAINDIEVRYLNEDQRPAFVLNDVKGADFVHVRAQKFQNAPRFVLKNVQNFSVLQSPPINDTRIERVELKRL